MKLLAYRWTLVLTREEEEPQVTATIQAAPAHVSEATFDRDYWLSHCEGFRVETANGRLGIVEEVRSRGEHEVVLAVRAGLLGRRLLLVSGRDVDFIVPRAQRLWLHSPPRIVGTESSLADR